jgi:hypothetical protein
MRFVLLVLTVGSVGCESTPPSAADSRQDRLGAWVPEASATILRLDQSSLKNPRHVVVEDRNSWQQLWTETWQGHPSPPTLPVIDFVLASVVVVAAGQRGPGYSVSVDSIVSYTTGGVAFATESQPGAGCTASPGTSAPVHMVFMPGHIPVVEWQVSSSVRVCP